MLTFVDQSLNGTEKSLRQEEAFKRLFKWVKQVPIFPVNRAVAAQGPFPSSRGSFDDS
jgi:hypothetical protein